MSRYSEEYWTTNLRTLLKSRVLRRIMPQLTVNIFVAVAVAAAHALLPSLPHITLQAHMLTGSFLGLLIAFRSNTGYERFWEARKVWDEVQRQCRSMARLVATCCSRPALVQRMLQILTAYPYALKQHLRGQFFPREMEKILPARDVRELATVPNMPVHLLMQLSVEARVLILESADDPAAATLWESCERHVQSLLKSVGTCERIAMTPVPLSYSRHTSRFLSLWTLSLPFSLVGSCGILMSVVAHAFICWSLLGTEEVGHMIEEPFGAPSEQRDLQVSMQQHTETLPLRRYCDAIRKDIEEVWRSAQAVTTAVPETPPPPADDSLRSLYEPPKPAEAEEPLGDGLPVLGFQV